MREEQQINIVMIMVFIIGIAGLILMGGIPYFAEEDGDPAKMHSIYIDDYRSDLYLNGTINESFKYMGETGTRSIDRIYRQWPYPLSFQNLSVPYVISTGIAHIPGAIKYAVDLNGCVRIFVEDASVVVFDRRLIDQAEHLDSIGSLAERNEAGCYLNSYFNPGRYTIKCIFRDHPFIERDEQYCHWNLMLADEHMAYQNITIRVHDPEGYILQLFTHPKMNTEKQNGTWIIRGSSPKNNLLEVEMLLKADAYELMDGFPRDISDVKGKITSANADTSNDMPQVKPAVGYTPSEEDGIKIDHYTADIYLNGTLEEEFHYMIFKPSEYRMLYRNFKALLSKDKLDEPYFEPILIQAPKNAPAISYMKDYRGRVWPVAENGTFYPMNMYDLFPVADHIRAQAKVGEIGYYSESRPFRQPIETTYYSKIYPLLQCDGSRCLISLNLAEDHFHYKHLNISVHDPMSQIYRIFEFSGLNISKKGYDWVITGEMEENRPLQIYLLADPDISKSFNGYIEQVQDAEGLALSHKSIYSRSYYLALAESIAVRMLVLLAPLILLLIYRRYGKEKQFTVPNVLSFVPSKRIPWQVNLIFKGDILDFDNDGFYATILDLHRQNAIDIISNEGGGMRIEVLKKPADVEDDYEKKVLNFIIRYAKDNVLDIDEFESKVEALRKRAEDDSVSALHDLGRIRNELNDLMAGPGEYIAQEFFNRYGRESAALVALPIALILATGFLAVIFGNAYPQLVLGFLSSLVLLVQISIPAFLMPKAFFGRWKADCYKEKLEWDAFKSFLSNFAIIQKYAPEDIVIWKEWLVYGTALGVGHNVVKAMDKLKIPAIPEVYAVLQMPSHIEHIHMRSAERVITKSELAAMSRSSGDGGSRGGGSRGGGFGGGGGHGGGGGGAR